MHPVGFIARRKKNLMNHLNDYEAFEQVETAKKKNCKFRLNEL